MCEDVQKEPNNQIILQTEPQTGSYIMNHF